MNLFQIVAIITVFAGTRDAFRKDSYPTIHPTADASGSVDEKSVADDAIEGAETIWDSAEGALMQAAMCAQPEFDKLYLEIEIHGYRKSIEFKYMFFENKLFEKWSPDFELIMNQEAERFKEALTAELTALYREAYSRILHI